MNGYERVMTAMKRGQPDRVPVIELSIDPVVIEGVVPGGDLPAFVEKLDLDAISCGTYYRRQTLPENRYRDEWGTIYHADPQLIGSPLDGPIHSMADLRRYTPPDPMDPERLGSLPAYVEQFKGQRAIVWHQREAFMTTALLSGLERFLMMLREEPDLVRAMVEMVVDVHVRLVRRAVRAGADIVSLGDDYAYRSGPMMSVAMFRKFFMPGMARVVAAAREEGALVLKHCDGKIWALMDSFIETGIDAINPLEPIADMDLAVAKRRYGDRLCLVGNVDCGYILSEASIAEVVDTVKKCILDGGPGGGYIICSSNSLHSSVLPQNYVAMVEAAHRYGAYPLDLRGLEAPGG
jgi:uroporphyrinogen decarboxylase